MWAESMFGIFSGEDFSLGSLSKPFHDTQQTKVHVNTFLILFPNVFTM